MAGERVVSLTLATGERVAVDQQRTPGRSYGEQFVIMFTAKAAEIARTIRKGTTLRVLMALPEHLDFENFRKLDQQLVSRQLGMTQSAVSKGMTELLDRQIVERQGKGPATLWRLSLDWGWKGNVESYHAAREKRRRGSLRPAEQSPDDCRRRDIM